MKHFLWQDPETLPHIEGILVKGGVLLTSTDTVLGLLADLTQESTLRINRIKKRSGKPYLILVSDVQKALGFVSHKQQSGLQIEKLMNICWPGPVTLLCTAKEGLPSYMQSQEGTVALRVPDHSQLLALLQKFDGLFSTSANSSGAPVPQLIEEVEKEILQEVDGVVLDKNEKKANVPSTILDCTGDQIKIVRQGAFSADMIKKLISE